MTGYTAKAQTEISASADRVWAAMTDPEQIKEYMFGSQVETDWKPGSPIRWKGEFDGKSYEDKGEVLEVEPGRRLKVTHFSPLTGQDDVPENYHTVTYDLDEHDGHTHVALTQDNAGSEQEAEHSSAMWQQMLDGLRKQVEG
jgi:uncharacterized protein YndB with AHSA1/START domain